MILCTNQRPRNRHSRRLKTKISRVETFWWIYENRHHVHGSLFYILICSREHLPETLLTRHITWFYYDVLSGSCFWLVPLHSKERENVGTWVWDLLAVSNDTIQQSEAASWWSITMHVEGATDRPAGRQCSMNLSYCLPGIKGFFMALHIQQK